MKTNTQTMTDEQTEHITATVSVKDVVQALKWNSTIGVDDRVIAVPQRDGVEATVRRAFQHTERYSNPSTAPVHIHPESLIDAGFTEPPDHHLARDWVRDEHNLSEHAGEWDKEWYNKVDEVHDVHVAEWEQNVRRMIADEHNLGVHKGVEVTLVGVTGDEQ